MNLASISQFLRRCHEDEKAILSKLLSFIPKADAVVDKVAPIAETIATAAGDPLVASYIEAGRKLFDDFAAAVEAGTATNADGSLTFTVTPDNVAHLKGVIGDAKTWLQQAGVKV